MNYCVYSLFLQPASVVTSFTMTEKVRQQTPNNFGSPGKHTSNIHSPFISVWRSQLWVGQPNNEPDVVREIPKPLQQEMQDLAVPRKQLAELKVNMKALSVRL